jgi:hypothetical protein
MQIKKKRLGTHYAQLVFMNLVGFAGHIMFSSASSM